MKVLVKASLLERIRRKELYIIFAIGALMILLTCTGNSSISINGESLVGFENKLMIFQIMVNFFSCILAVVLSMHTIPNEYERRNSHLVWIRGISQRKYHGSLCIANAIVCMMVLLVFYLMLGVFVVMNGQAALLLKVLPAYFITGINVLFVSALTGALSVIVPTFITGTIGIVCVVLGTFYPVISLAKDVLGGLGGQLLSIAFKVIPNLHGVQNQAYRMMLGQDMSINKILAVLLGIYVVSMGIVFFKKKEA